MRQRIHFIADLFRVYQERAALFGEPFTAEQVLVIKAGGRPAGPLYDGPAKPLFESRSACPASPSTPSARKPEG